MPDIPTPVPDLPDNSSGESRMADTPVPTNLNQKRQGTKPKNERLRTAKFAGLLLYLAHSEDPDIECQISLERKEWIGNFLSKLSIELLDKSFSFYLSILTNKRVRNSLRDKIERELRTYRTPPTINRKEPRRIGVGYRDKGALRPLHLQRVIGEERFWFEDIRHLVSMSTDKEFVTAEEVLSSWIEPDTILIISNQVRLMVSFETLN